MYFNSLILQSQKNIHVNIQSVVENPHFSYYLLQIQQSLPADVFSSSFSPPIYLYLVCSYQKQN